MKQLLKPAAAPAVGLLALALTSITTPAAAAKYDIDAPTSRLRCEAAALPRWGKAMSAGRGGTCARSFPAGGQRRLCLPAEGRSAPCAEAVSVLRTGRLDLQRAAQ